MKTNLFSAAALFASIILLAPGAVTEGAEISVLSSGASSSAVSELGPLFERSTGHKVAIRFANNPILKKEIEAGAQFDVVIIEPRMIDELTKQGKLAAGSRVDVARVGMALGGRAGSPEADIGTVEAFKRFLKNADSVAYTADGHSGKVFIRTLERLGLLEELKPKLRPAVGRTASSLVTSGKAQTWAGPISTPTPGTQILGRFPEEIQTYVGITAAISVGASTPDVAQAFITFLASEEAGSVFATKGFQPIPIR